VTEENTVTVRANNATQIVITDLAGLTGDTNLCSFRSATEAVCAAPREVVQVFTQGGDDQVEYRAPHPGYVDLGAGDDVIVAGTRSTWRSRQRRGGRTAAPRRVDIVSVILLALELFGGRR
jgi:hypothetical protein